MITTPKLKRVMFIDDDDATNFFHQSLSKEVNLAANLDVHNNATEALKVLNEITDKYEFPELIFVDINMPKINGHEFTQLVQDMPGFNPNRTCVALLTNSKSIGDVIEADQNEVEHFYWKPLNTETLNQVLKDGLGIHSGLE